MVQDQSWLSKNCRLKNDHGLGGSVLRIPLVPAVLSPPRAPNPYYRPYHHGAPLSSPPSSSHIPIQVERARAVQSVKGTLYNKCGRTQVTSSSIRLIANGRLAGHNEFPSYVLILLQVRENGEILSATWGGTLISKHFVLTAAHCLSGVR